jgi:S-DNA-T family DNA segregation ATPase FtsK/SpoIIIE
VNIEEYHVSPQNANSITPEELLSFEEPEIARMVETAYEEVQPSAAMTSMTSIEEEALEVVKQAPKKKEDSSKEEAIEQTEQITKEIEESTQVKEKEYIFPPIDLLKRGAIKGNGDSDSHLRETASKLQQTLQNFGVRVNVTNISCGPTVTRYELQPEMGVKVSKIVSLSDDIKLNLAAADIRIEAPIPGKAAVGIEVPNKENSTVMLRDLLETEEFKKHSSNIAFAAGKDISGHVVVTDIAKMPHLLIAGSTGSGKSVCINTLIMSILYKANPDDVKLIMIDPKVVELSVYNGIPHLFIPVVTDPKKAAGALNWAVAEMTTRYKLFADLNVRDLKGYNEKIKSIEHIEEENKPEKLPQIIIIVDELADLMMVAPGEVEDSICRLAQLARAAGLHLIIATQRPSVNVITGLIKANMPSRIAFAVSSGVDSRTIIDMNGAEKLLGKGDMLFYPQGYQKPARVQGAFVSDKEVSDVVEFLTSKHGVTEYNKDIEATISNASSAAMEVGGSATERDSYFVDAGKFIIEKDKASIGMLQRVFKIGFNRAARIMDQLCDAGVVGEEEGTKPRKVLMTIEEFEEFIDECV